jgi:heme/copper-type cytochrome/quinol oxidase subunit 2
MEEERGCLLYPKVYAQTSSECLKSWTKVNIYIYTYVYIYIYIYIYVYVYICVCVCRERETERETERERQRERERETETEREPYIWHFLFMQEILVNDQYFSIDNFMFVL